MISESVASLFSVCEIAIISAIGEMIRTSAGMTRLVMPRKVTIVCPWLVIRSMPRNACVIQITPVRLTRTSANDASVVRKIYLSIDPIVTARSPPRDPKLRLATNPEFRDPLWSHRHRPAGSLSHYHPFDPSTKWLRHGALGIWLIIRAMWPPGHVRRFAARRLTGHSGPDRALDGRASQPKRTFRNRPAGSRPSDSPDFGGFAYARRRQGRLRSVFHRPARRSGGILRRYLQVPRGAPQAAG